jgi:hypothetical protein
MPFITIELNEQQKAKIAELVRDGKDFRIDGGQVGGWVIEAIDVRFKRVPSSGPYCIYCGAVDCLEDHRSVPGPGPIPNYRPCCGQVVMAHGCEWGHKKDCPLRSGRSPVRAEAKA